MPDEDKKIEGEGGKQEPQAPVLDAFGNSDAPIEAPKKEDKKEEGKKFDAIPDDHPAIAALKQQIEDVKKEYGGNLSGQREVIKNLEAKLATIGKGVAGAGEGGEEDPDMPYKKDEIKFSKDLTKDEREEMTDTEIKQMDEIAKMKENQNKMYLRSKETVAKVEGAKVNDLNSLVQSTARELAGGDIDVANQIIEQAKMFVLEGLDVEKVKERVAAAAKLTPNYKPPKEQTTRHGAPVKKNSVADDPFGVDKIIAEATKPNNGTYSL
jgi:hypothetical protein